MNAIQTTRSSQRLYSLPILGLICTALLGTACGNWDQFGNGPLNPHNTIVPGPEAGITVQTDLLHPVAGSNHGSEVGVLVDRNGEYYVSSYDSEIHAYDHAGTWMGSYDLGVDGSRAAPYVHTEPLSMGSRATIFTGAEGGGFYAIDVDKTTVPFTMTLTDSDLTFGTSESSPKRARDKTLYIAGQWGDVTRYEYTGAGLLLRLNTLPLGEVITGAIALYDIDPQYPDEEVLVATADGNFYVLDHRLTTILWSETTGAATSDLYYAGVTVAERGGMAPVALLPIASDGGAATNPNSGMVRAINLWTHGVEWELVPSETSLAEDAIEGSIAVLHDQAKFSTHDGGDDDGFGHDTPVLNNPGANDQNTGFQFDHLDPNKMMPFHATFASTDSFLYGIDIVAGVEIWKYQMRTSGYDAPVVDGNNIIYVGDGTTTLHAVEGKWTCPGCGIWNDNSISVGGVSDIVKLGVTNDRGLVVGSGGSAYALFQ